MYRVIYLMVKLYLLLSLYVTVIRLLFMTPTRGDSLLRKWVKRAKRIPGM